MDVHELKKHLRALAQWRAEVDRIQELVVSAEKTQQESTAWLALEAAIRQRKEAIGEMQAREVEVREMVTAHFVATGEKKPVAGAEVREYKTFEFDAEEALEWATLHVPSALKLDVKLFKKVAPALGGPIREIPSLRVYLSRDLSAYLEEDEDGGMPEV